MLPIGKQKKSLGSYRTAHRKGATMVTDGLAMYAYLGQDDKFKHVIVDHKAGQYVNGGFHTNGIENFWSLLKRGIIGIFHQLSSQHLQRYCDEFAARYNNGRLSITSGLTYINSDLMVGLHTISL
jgi:ISXO2 transposase-like protein